VKQQYCMEERNDNWEGLGVMLTKGPSTLAGKLWLAKNAGTKRLSSGGRETPARPSTKKKKKTPLSAKPRDVNVQRDFPLVEFWRQRMVRKVTVIFNPVAVLLHQRCRLLRFGL
jgi:hypothetical protein